MNPGFPDNAVYLIEDNPDDQFAVRRSFQQAGLDNPVIDCTSGDEALARLRAAAAANAPLPMVLLLDINLPGTKGQEVLKALRADTHPGLQHLPVIMLTSSNDDRDVAAAFQGQANAYLQKPLIIMDFLQALLRIRGRRLRLSLHPVS